MINFKNIEIEEKYEYFNVFDIRKYIIRINNFCLVCGKRCKDLRSTYCLPCSISEQQKELWTHPTQKMFRRMRNMRAKGVIVVFSNSEKAQIWQDFKNGMPTRDLSQKFGSSGSTISRLLYSEHREEYKKKVKKLQYERGQKSAERLNKQKAKNHNFTSRPEVLFYITRLTKNFYPKDIVPQYFIKEIRHYVDFAILSQKLLFEVDGDHFHGHSGNAEMDRERIARDKEVDKWAKDNGWTMFRFNDEKMRKLGIIK